MPYKFGEYVSTYVDPQSVKISETLRNRFVNNLQANDQLAMAVDQMQAALPFENDVQRKKELQRVAENTLGQLAETGDYENQGMPIRKAAIDFTKEYAPIKENYQRYSTYINEFNEALKKGDYNPEQQKLLSQYMLRTANGPYKGFEIDPQTGKVKEGSLFTGPTIYKDPKIMDRVTERLKILHEEKTGRTVQKVGQGADGSLTIESGGTISKIDPAKVQQVVDAVMAEADVKAYVEQLADMKAYSYQANGQLPQVFNAQVQGYTDAVQKINEALDGGGLSSADRAALKNQLTTYTQELNKLKEASQDENLMYSYIKSKAQDEIEAPVRQFASLKGGIYEQTSVYKENYDQKKLDEINRLEQWKLEHPEMTTTSPVNATAWGGKDAAEKAQNIANYKKQAAELTAAAGAENLDPAEKDKYLKLARQALQNASLIEQQLVTAGDKAFTMDELKAKDPSLVEATIKAFPNATVGQIYAKISSLEKGSTDYNQIGKAFKTLYGSNLDGHMVMYYSDGTGATDVKDFEYNTGSVARNTAGEAQSYIEKIKSGQFGFVPRGEFVVKEVESNMTNNKKQYVVLHIDDNAPINVTGSWAGLNDNKVTKTLKEIKTASVGYSGQMPGITTQGKVKATNAFNAYFGKNFTLGENQILTLPDGTNLSGKDLAGFQSTGAYTFYPKIGSSAGSTEITFTKTVDGKTQLITGYFDNQQASNEEVRNYLNSDEFRFATTVDRMDPKGNGEVSLGLNTDPTNPEPTFNMVVKNGANNELLVKFESLNSANPTSTKFMGLDNPQITGGYNEKGQWTPGWMQVVAPSLP